MADIRKLIQTGANRDTMRTAFPILNMVIDSANESLNTANEAKAEVSSAVQTANEANAKSDDTQQQLNNIVINNGESDAEVLQARGTYPVLNERLQATDEQLAERPSYDEARLKAEKLGQLDMTEEFLQQMAGNTPINSIPADNSITQKKLSFKTVVGRVGKNLFDKNAATIGYYVSNTTGELVASGSFATSDYIPVLPNTGYSRRSKRFLAYYDINKTFISGVVDNTTFVFTTPSNCYYIRSSLLVEDLDTSSIELGPTNTTYEPYRIVVDPETIQEKSIPGSKIDGLNFPTSIAVKKDGTGDFSSLRYAIESITDASESKPYVIELHEGEYAIFSDFTEVEITNTSFVGIRLPNYVSLLGIGKMENIIIKGELSDTLDSATKSRVSTLNLQSVHDIENITFTGKNVRYALHDDNNTVGIRAKRNIKKCTFIKFSGGTMRPAYGAGCLNGAEYYYEDCEFISDIGKPFSLHNNVNFTENAKFKLKNCRFINRGISTSTEEYNYSAEFIDVGSGTQDEIEMIGCYAPRGILFRPETTNTAGTVSFKITGYGNSLSPNRIANTDGLQKYYDFNEENARFYCYETNGISKKGLVKHMSYRGGIKAFLSTDSHILFAGIALTDAINGAECIVKTKGYIHVSDTNLSSVNLGDKIGIVNGVLAVVTTGDYIGVCKFPNYIYLL
jgi:hypothetical protein